MKFNKHNENPKGNKTGDCSIRAIAFATNKSWRQVFEELYELARINYWGISNIETLEHQLCEFEMIVPKVIKGSKRPKVKDFTKGTYILRLANHITCVKDGVLYDTWDCREKAVYRYWEVKQ